MRNSMFHFSTIIILLLSILSCPASTQAQKTSALQDNTCEICERIYRIDTLMASIASAYWPGLDDARYPRSPVLF